MSGNVSPSPGAAQANAWRRDALADHKPTNSKEREMTTREMEYFAVAVPEPERAAAGGRQ